MKVQTNKNLQKKPLDGIDWGITLAPLLIILVISAALMLVPNQSKQIITILRSFFVNDLRLFIFVGAWYIGAGDLAGIFQIWPRFSLAKEKTIIL